MKTIHFILATALIALFSSCSEADQAKFASLCGCPEYDNEYEALYEPSEQLKIVSEEIKFWENRIEETGPNLVYNSKLASAYSGQFKLTADIASLKQAEFLLQENVSSAPDNCNAKRALARNFISQHRFKEAKSQLLAAKEIGENKRSTDMLLYDVALELAEDELAEELLSKIAAKKDFNYLIREAKWQDGQGNLDEAIALLEQAKNSAEASKSKVRLNWIYSNLGDFYGHAGRLEDSEKSFEKALEVNPADYYSFKGLAYMKWAAEQDAQQSLDMLEQVAENSSDPSTFILKADILDHQGQKESANEIRNFIDDKVSSSSYGAMYHSFLIHNSLAKNELETADLYAQLEMETRETPESYALLALTKYHLDQEEEALEIAMNEVVGKTYEPKTLLNVLPVTAEAKSLKEAILFEVEEASYELGPLAYARIGEY